mmetsp:Transcript_110523/g.312640  ORF Transcript_110523/g.312640 Transcript_110523/m.312640 type:complete len:206 (+) Transcript_110523:378-995(+)
MSAQSSAGALSMKEATQSPPGAAQSSCGGGAVSAPKIALAGNPSPPSSLSSPAAVFPGSKSKSGEAASTRTESTLALPLCASPVFPSSSSMPLRYPARVLRSNSPSMLDFTAPRLSLHASIACASIASSLAPSAAPRSTDVDEARPRSPLCTPPPRSSDWVFRTASTAGSTTSAQPGNVASAALHSGIRMPRSWKPRHIRCRWPM